MHGKRATDTMAQEVLETEKPDEFSSSVEYTKRFSGAIGEWMLSKQANIIGDIFKTKEALNILDVGGGHAQVYPILLELGHSVTCLSSEGVSPRLSYIRGDRLNFTRGNLLSLPFGDNSFDYVVSLRIASHVSDLERFLNEACRVAIRGIVIDYASIKSVNILSESLFWLKKLVEGNTKHFKCYSDRRVREVLENNGFELCRISRQFFFPMALHRALKMPIISQLLENVASSVGLTKALGSPVIVEARRCE